MSSIPAKYYLLASNITGHHGRASREGTCSRNKQRINGASFSTELRFAFFPDRPLSNLDTGRFWFGNSETGMNLSTSSASS